MFFLILSDFHPHVFSFLESLEFTLVLPGQNYREGASTASMESNIRNGVLGFLASDPAFRSLSARNLNFTVIQWEPYVVHRVFMYMRA